VARNWFSPVLVLLAVKIVGIGANTNALDPFLTDVESAAPLAPVDGQLVAFADVTGRSVPEFQGDAVPIRGMSVAVKNLAASRISTRENQLSSHHPDSPPVSSLETREQ